MAAQAISQPVVGSAFDFCPRFCHTDVLVLVEERGSGGAEMDCRPRPHPRAF